MPRSVYRRRLSPALTRGCPFDCSIAQSRPWRPKKEWKASHMTRRIKEKPLQKTPETTFLILIDVQEKLVAAMHHKASLVENVIRLVKGLRILGVPVLFTEQNPAGLGPTIPPLRLLLADNRPITKLSFSCCGEKAFLDALKVLRRQHALVCGIECHVCVYQSVADLVAQGYEVQVVSDAVASRTLENKEIGLQRCREMGASITSVETILFELLRRAEGPAFKEILGVVK